MLLNNLHACNSYMYQFINLRLDNVIVILRCYFVKRNECQQKFKITRGPEVIFVVKSYKSKLLTTFSVYTSRDSNETICVQYNIVNNIVLVKSNCC